MLGISLILLLISMTRYVLNSHFIQTYEQQSCSAAHTHLTSDFHPYITTGVGEFFIGITKMLPSLTSAPPQHQKQSEVDVVQSVTLPKFPEVNFLPSIAGVGHGPASLYCFSPP